MFPIIDVQFVVADRCSRFEPGLAAEAVQLLKREAGADDRAVLPVLQLPYFYPPACAGGDCCVWSCRFVVHDVGSNCPLSRR